MDHKQTQYNHWKQQKCGFGKECCKSIELYKEKNDNMVKEAYDKRSLLTKLEKSIFLWHIMRCGKLENIILTDLLGADRTADQLPWHYN